MQKSVSVIDKPLSKGKKEVSLSAFSYMFSELVQYCQAKVDSTQELQQKLSDAGYGIGLKVLELLSLREKGGRKEKNLISMLQFVHSTCWKSLFGRVASGLEKSTEGNDTYFLKDNSPITNRFMSVPKNLGHLNCASFVAGIINGILDGAEYKSTVTAMFQANQQVETVYVIKFEPHVIAREG